MAPAALARRLGHTGWVENAADGWRLQARLRPGQSLVDRDGRLWRWDGFVRIGAGSSATAEQLRQRNRLEQLECEIAGRERKRGRPARRPRAAGPSARRPPPPSAPPPDIARRRGTAGARAPSRGRAVSSRPRVDAKLAAVVEIIDKIGTELAELATQIAEADSALALLADPAVCRAALDTARSDAGEARRRDADARAALDRLCARPTVGAGWRRLPRRRSPGASGVTMPRRSRRSWSSGTLRRRRKSRLWSAVRKRLPWNARR